MLLGGDENSKRAIVRDGVEIGKIRKGNRSFQSERVKIRPASGQRYAVNERKPGISYRKTVEKPRKPSGHYWGRRRAPHPEPKK